MTENGEHPTVNDVANAALEHGLSIGVAESLTSGLVASELGKGHDASEWFRGGVVAYSTQVKQDVLHVDPGPVVSDRCARQMAVGAARVLGADLAVATTGAGGPDPVEGRPPGTVHLGWAAGDRSGSEEHHFDGDPARVVESAVEAAIALLSRVMAELGD